MRPAWWASVSCPEDLIAPPFQANEIKVDAGEIRLADRHKADASFTFWHDHSANGCLLVAEFSYDFLVEKHNTDDRKAATQCANRHRTQLQRVFLNR